MFDMALGVLRLGRFRLGGAAIFAVVTLLMLVFGGGASSGN